MLIVCVMWLKLMHTMQRVWSIKLKLFRDNTQHKKFRRCVRFPRFFLSVSLQWTSGFEEQMAFFQFLLNDWETSNMATETNVDSHFWSEHFHQSRKIQTIRWRVKIVKSFHWKPILLTRLQTSRFFFSMTPFHSQTPPMRVQNMLCSVGISLMKTCHTQF